MQKNLTVLFAFAIFVLVMGLQTDSYAGHKDKHNPGGDDGGGGKVVAEYSVNIKGAVSGHSFDNWRTQSAHGIGWSDPHDFAGEFTDLSFFEDHFNEIEENTGSNCFGNVEWLYGNFKQRKGSAGGSLWINGLTDDGNTNTPVVYLLHVFGDSNDKDWPRPSEGTLVADMTGWEMGIENGQSDLFNISCIKEGTFDTGFMTIEVTREN